MIGYTEKYFTEDGSVWFPIMGEYEFSRTERGEWEKGIAKMKALGINTVQTYVIWLHHEEVKGHFNFRGNNNLRAFIRLVKEAKMKMCLRVGPWVHAELRGGGFPDWVYESGYKPRQNDSAYFADVERYFREIYLQCKGYFASEGGPIFSIQVENEYRRYIAGSSEESNKHINILIKMLCDIGFDVPIYIGTAWGNSVTGEALPTWGEYAAQPWEQHAGELPANSAYLIGTNPNEVPVGEYKERPAALGENELVKTNVPYLTIEQGSGNQPTKLRRPIVTGEDNGAMLFCRLAQGLVGIGYYVFHGGINPVGVLSTTEEYRDEEYMNTRYGYFCDLAERNYDFQGAVSMYNRITENGRELKIWNTFANEFKEILCKADVKLGEGNATDPEDLDSPRYSVRKSGSSGFLFYNNYLRRRKMPSKEIKGFSFDAENEKIILPDVVLGDGEYMAFPFNLPFGNCVLRYATATPLCTLNGDTVVLFNKIGKAQYDSTGGKVIVINKEEARNSFKIKASGREYLIITEAELYPEGEKLRFEYAKEPTLKIYPRPIAINGFDYVGDCGDFAVFKAEDERSSVGASYRESERTSEYTDYTVRVAYGEEIAEEAYLGIDFDADLAEIYIDGEKVNDMFYTGVPFEVSMRYHGFPREFVVRLFPLEKDREIYLEKQPRYDGAVACSLNGVSIETVKSIFMEIKNEI